MSDAVEMNMDAYAEALLRCSSELSQAQAMLDELQEKVLSNIGGQVPLDSETIATIQNTDLSKQMITCVADFLTETSKSLSGEGLVKVNIQLRPADVGARILGHAADETVAADEDYLF